MTKATPDHTGRARARGKIFGSPAVFEDFFFDGLDTFVCGLDKLGIYDIVVGGLWSYQSKKTKS